MNIEQIENSILEYFEGTLTPDQEKTLLAEVDGNAEYKALFEEYRREQRALEGYFKGHAEVVDRVARPDLSALPMAMKATQHSRTRNIYLAAAAAIFLTVAGAATLAVATHKMNLQDMGTVVAVAGRPQALLEKGLVDLASNTKITSGVRDLKTTARSYLEVALKDNAGNVELNSNSAVRLHNSRKGPEVELVRGEVIADARDNVRVRTPQLEASGQDATFSVVRGLRGTEVGVVKGEVEVTQSGTRKRLRAGETFSSLGVKTVSVADRVSWSRHPATVKGALALAPAPEPIVLALAEPTPSKQPKTTNSTSAQPATRAALSAPVASSTAPVSLNAPATVSNTATPYLPSNTYLMVEIPSIGDLLGTVGSSDLRSALSTQRLHDAMANAPTPAGTLTDEDINAAVTQIEGFLNDPDVHSFLSALTNSVSLGVTPEGPVLVADLGADSGVVGAIVASRLQPALDGMGEPHLHATVAGHFLILGADGAAFAESRAAALAGTPTPFGNSPFVAAAHAATGSSRLSSAINVAGFNQHLRDEGLPVNASKTMRRLGFENMQYVLAGTHFGDQANNQALRVTFDGQRQGVMNWLDEPGAMGSLKFYSPDAHFIAAAKIKRPEDMLNQVFTWISEDDPNFHVPASDQEIALLHTVASTLGGEAAVGLDNPVLPVPNVKFAIETVDPNGFHDGIVQLVDMLWTSPSPTHDIDVETETYRDHLVVDFSYPGAPVSIAYTIVDDFVVFAPGKPFIHTAIDTALDNHSIDQEYAFTQALPAISGSQTSLLVYGSVGHSLTEVLPYAQQFLSQVNPNIVAQIQQAQTSGATSGSTVGYAIASGDAIDFYVNGLRTDDFRFAGLIPAVADWARR